MGRDKALLPLGDVPLLVHIARIVQAAAGSATLVGPRARYGGLGWPLIEDALPGEGPAGGLLAALSNTSGRGLIAACNMPWLTMEVLHSLIEHESQADVVASRSDRGVEPLCAVYDRRCLPALRAAFDGGERALHRILGRLEVEEWPIADPRLVYNANTPGEWAAVEAKR